MIFWLNIATIVFSLITCGFSAASIISMRRLSRQYSADINAKGADVK